MRDGETTRSSSAGRLVGGLGKTLSPSGLICLLGRLLFGFGAFVNSRRWLIGSLLITGLLLALMLLARPTPRLTSNTPGEPDIVFDDVKSFPAGPVGSAVPLPESTASEEGEKTGEPMALSRRLDAVRSRRARGAWLTGTIDTMGESPSLNSASNGPPQMEIPKQAELQRAVPVLR